MLEQAPEADGGNVRLGGLERRLDARNWVLGREFPPVAWADDRTPLSKAA